MTLKFASQFTEVIENASKSFGMVYYWHYIVTMTVSLAVSEILSVKLWRDLEIWVGSRSKSLKMTSFGTSYDLQLVCYYMCNSIFYHFRDI